MDVCQVLNDADESENESDDGNVVVVVELHLMGEDGLELVERLELVVVQEVEDDFRRSWVLSTKACMLDSTVCFICCIISSGLKDTLGPGCVDGGATGVGGSGACGVD